MKLRTASIALVAGLTAAAPVAAIAAPPAAITHVAKSDAKPAPAPHSDSSRYADREANEQAVQHYEGGNTVVIAMSGGALVVLLFLLLLI